MFSVPAASAPGETPVHLSAIYRIQFSALGNVGTIQSRSERNGSAMTLRSQVRIDTAVFDYAADLDGTATLAGRRVRPNSFVSSTRQKALFGKKKHASLNMSYMDGAPAKRTFVPPWSLSPENVPVTEVQLKGALDPLAAIMAMSLADLARPCDQKLAIFDGKQRFDIAFSETGRIKLAGSPGTGHVCRVAYTPVSGHKPGKGSGLSRIDKIEVVMRPVPSANIVVPYRVTVSTMAGDIVIAAERIDIKMPNQAEIALRH